MIDLKELRYMQFFSELDDAELEAVSKIMVRKKYKPGDHVCKETDRGDSLYIIRKGEVKACKIAADGELFTLTVMHDGDIFGEMSFLDDRPHSASIVAISDLEVLVMTRKEFETLVDTNPWVVYKLLKNIVYTVHAIVKGMNTRYMEMLNYMWGRKRG